MIEDSLYKDRIEQLEKIYINEISETRKRAMIHAKDHIENLEQLKEHVAKFCNAIPYDPDILKKKNITPEEAFDIIGDVWVESCLSDPITKEKLDELSQKHDKAKFHFVVRTALSRMDPSPSSMDYFKVLGKELSHLRIDEACSKLQEIFVKNLQTSI